MKAKREDFYWPTLGEFLIICIMLATSGCADQSIRELNTQIMESNSLSRIAYAEGMAGCNSDAACMVGVTASYFSSSGQQQLVKPDTSLDYVKATLPFAQLGLQAFGMYWYGQGNGTNGDRSSMFVKGDGNTFVMGNKLSADNQGSTALSFSQAYTRSWDGGYNREYTNQEPIMTLEGIE
jgi:hypothetical protein